MMKRISSVIKIAELVILLLISLIIVGYLWTALIYMLLFNLILFDYFFMKKWIYSCSISTIQKIINFLHIKFGLETIDRDEPIVFISTYVVFSFNFYFVFFIFFIKLILTLEILVNFLVVFHNLNFRIWIHATKKMIGSGSDMMIAIYET